MATFWNSLCDRSEDHMYASILRDSWYYGVTTHSPTWAGSFMRALRKLGYPYPVDCHSPHEVDIDTFRAILTSAQRLSDEGLHISPRRFASTYRTHPLSPVQSVYVTCVALRWGMSIILCFIAPNLLRFVTAIHICSRPPRGHDITSSG
eukprot:jgi/Botrbrau1/21329/Bobra.0184s0039.1